MCISYTFKKRSEHELISLEFPNVVYDVDNTLGTNEFRITYHPDRTTDFGGVADETNHEKIVRRSQYNIEKMTLSRATPAGGQGLVILRSEHQMMIYMVTA